MSAVKPLNPLKTPHFRTKYLGNDFILPRYKNAVARRVEPFMAIYDGFMFSAVQNRLKKCLSPRSWILFLREQTEQPRRREQISKSQEQEPTTSRVGYNRIIYIISRFRQILGFQISQIRQISADLSRFCQIL